MTVSAALERGRDAFAARAWDAAYAELSAADRDSPLTPAELEQLAAAAYLTRHDGESDEYWTRSIPQQYSSCRRHEKAELQRPSGSRRSPTRCLGDCGTF
jgi:hypothetical protein